MATTITNATKYKRRNSVDTAPIRYIADTSNEYKNPPLDETPTIIRTI